MRKLVSISLRDNSKKSHPDAFTKFSQTKTTNQLLHRQNLRKHVGQKLQQTSTMALLPNTTNLLATVAQEGPNKLNLLDSTAGAEQEGASKRFSLDTLSSMDLVRGNA